TVNVENCTFAFLYDSTIGKGTAIIVRANCTANIRKCIFAHGEGPAVSTTYFDALAGNKKAPNAFISLDENLFHDAMGGLLLWMRPGASQFLKTSDVDELRDTVLKSAKDNAVSDPGFDYDADYVSAFRARYAPEGDPDATTDPDPDPAPADNSGGDGDMDFDFDFGGDVAPPPSSDPATATAPEKMFAMRYSLDGLIRLAHAMSGQGRGASSSN
ncbi:MAG: hypothetical protein AB7S36_09225, partial [Planctomycetota bacterium]